MALWGGRFTQAADQRLTQSNDSLRFDYRLAEQDTIGSVAWSNALVTVNVLTQAEVFNRDKAIRGCDEASRQKADLYVHIAEVIIPAAQRQHPIRSGRMRNGLSRQDIQNNLERRYTRCSRFICIKSNRISLG